MLEQMNRYIHGYVFIPVIQCINKKGLLNFKKPWVSNELAEKFQANIGYLNVALRMFESLGWLKKNKKRFYQWAIPQEMKQILALIPSNYLSLYAISIET